MKQNIKRAFKFGIPVLLFFTVFLSWIVGLREGFLPGLFIGLFFGGLLALMVGFVNSETAKEAFAEYRWDKEKISRMGLGFKRLFPTCFILLIGASLTRYTGKLYLFFISSIALCMVVSFLQSIKSGEYRKAKAEGEVTTYYALFLTLPVSLFSLFVFFLILVYSGDLREIIKLF